MKISKLFHWLYAFLMFLPIFFVLGKGLYVTFNKNAKDSYYGETINEEIYNIPTIKTELRENEYVIYNGVDLDSYGYGSMNSTQIWWNSVTYNNVIYNNAKLTYYINALNQTLSYLYDENNAAIFADKINSTLHLEGNINYIVSNLNLTLILSQFQYITYNQYSYLDNAIDYGMYQLNESNLFAWAKDSFLSAPFVYITNLFNMPSDSPVITALSYWLNISIIWLTFDVIMYVPLLAHRWLDKGVRE